MPLVEATASRRDQLSAALEAAEASAVSGADATGAAAAGAIVEGAETAEQQAERLRDASGKFATPDKAVKQKEDEKVQDVTPAVPRPKPPSSWKKDYHTHWESLDPKLADYINQRESEYVRGVSAYKAEAEQARQLNEAMAPFVPTLRQYGIEPAAWIRNLGSAHQSLVSSPPSQRVQTFAGLMRDYQIDPQALFTLLSNPQPMQQMQQAQPRQEPADIEAAVKSVLMHERSAQEVQSFLADADKKYPHYQQVKDDMIRLLKSGATQDLVSAYDKAIRLNDDIWQAEQERKRSEAEADRVKQQAEAVARARAKAISTRSATPSGAVKPDAKDRRSQIAEALGDLENRV